MFLVKFGIKELKVLSTMDIEEEIWFPSSRTLLFSLKSPYHTYRLPMGRRCLLWTLGSKGQMPNAAGLLCRNMVSVL
jgi:hypothetical protein